MRHVRSFECRLVETNAWLRNSRTLKRHRKCNFVSHQVREMMLQDALSVAPGQSSVCVCVCAAPADEADELLCQSAQDQEGTRAITREKERATLNCRGRERERVMIAYSPS